MSHYLRPLVACLLVLTPVPVSAFTAKNGMVVAPVGKTEIAVGYEVRRADTDYWCAAGDFAERVLGLPSDTRMWRATPAPRANGGGIGFTLDPANKAESGGVSEFGSGPQDGSMSIGMAAGNYCRRFPPFW